MTAQLSPARLGDILSAFSSGMQVPNVEGRQADSEHTNEDRIVWIPKTFGAGKPMWHPTNAEAVWSHATGFDVCIYALEFGTLWERWHDLVAWTDTILGPPGGDPDGGPGYEIGTSNPEPRGEPAGQQGWGVTIRVTIKGPIIRRTFPAATVASTTYTVETTDLDGANVETAI